MTALRTGKAVNNYILGIVQAPNQSCRWIRVNALPRLYAEMQIPIQVYTFFVEIPQPQSESQKA